MQLRWTEAAANDLEDISDYLFHSAPEHAERILRAVYNEPTALLIFPYRGRSGKKAGTRELVLTSLPYIVVYEVTEDTINLIRILHAAQKWP